MFAIVSGPSVDSVVSGSVVNSCLRCGLGEPVGLRVYGTRKSEGL